MKSCHKQPIHCLCLGSHHRTSHSSPGVDQYCTAPCWILRSWPAVFLFPLLLNCWVFRILWCEGNVTSLLPIIFYIWGYFSPWVWSIAGRYQMHQLLSCADPRQVIGSVDQRHSQEFSGNLVTQGEKACC